MQNIQIGLEMVKEVNREALEEHLNELRKTQGAMQGNQLNILENQNTTHDNQRNMLENQNTYDEPSQKTKFSKLIAARLPLTRLRQYEA